MLVKDGVTPAPGVGLSLLLFVVFFSVVLIVVVCMDRAQANRLASLPMDEDAGL